MVCCMTYDVSMDLSGNLASVQKKIVAACEHAGRDPHEVRLVAVTKSVDADTLNQLVALGVKDVAENRVQVAEEKGFGELPREVTRHMVGHLQTNKVKECLRLFDIIHSVDSLKLAEVISRSAGELGVTANVLFQMNIAEEPQKYGFHRDTFLHSLHHLAELPNLNKLGLMSMAREGAHKDEIRSTFRALREVLLFIRDQNVFGDHFKELSMGMTDDFEIAIEEGATMVRVGRALFA